MNKVVAFQEHRLCHKLAIANASTHADRYGFRTAFSMGVKTQKGGASSGVGFLWPKHIETQNPGKLFDESRIYSIEVPHSVFGMITMVSFYCTTGTRDQTLENLKRVIDRLELTRCPYIICGDFNIEVQDVSDKLIEWNLQARTMHGGASCFSKDSASTIDFFITSQMFRAQSITCYTSESGLANRPVMLMFQSFQDTGRVKWIEKPRGLPRICCMVPRPLWFGTLGVLK